MILEDIPELSIQNFLQVIRFHILDIQGTVEAIVAFAPLIGKRFDPIISKAVFLMQRDLQGIQHQLLCNALRGIDQSLPDCDLPRHISRLFHAFPPKSALNSSFRVSSGGKEAFTPSLMESRCSRMLAEARPVNRARALYE